MKTIKFWTSTEIKIAKKALDKDESVVKIARKLSTKLKRPLSGVTAKLYEIKKGTVSEIPKKGGVEMPSDLNFEISPKKIIMYNGMMLVKY
jgi:ATP-dependent protease Clp ATPase subunit